MTGLLLVLSKSKIRHWLPWKQKYFTVAYRIEYVFINFACSIALTIDIHGSTPKVYDFYRELDFYDKIMRQFWEKNIVLMNIHEYANELICIF